jgi:hypothetical protein
LQLGLRFPRANEIAWTGTSHHTQAGSPSMPRSGRGARAGSDFQIFFSSVAQ